MAESGNGTFESPEEKRAAAEWQHRQTEDYLWALGQADLSERYRGQVVAMHNRVVLGSGVTGLAAREDARHRAAERGDQLPPEGEWLYVIMPKVLHLDETMLPPHLRNRNREDSRSRVLPT